MPAAIGMGERGLKLQDLDQLWRFSGILKASNLCPKDMGQEALFIAIQMGLEIGLSPMQAIQSTAVINGRPSIYGDAALGLIRATGLIQEYDECECDSEIDVLFRKLCLSTDEQEQRELQVAIAQGQATMDANAPDYGVTVFSWRKGHKPHFGRFTVEDATIAGLWGKAGPWKQYPSRMLKWRARGFILRDDYGDVLKGLRTVEEERDMDPIDVTPQKLEALPAGRLDLKATKPTKNGHKAKAADVAPPAPVQETSSESEPDPQPEPDQPDIHNEAAEQESAERFQRAMQIRADCNIIERSWRADLAKRWGGKTWEQLTADEQEQEIQHLESKRPIGAK